MDSQTQGKNKMDINQHSQSKRGKNKRFWVRDEEWALVNGLLELSADPLWKAEGNFKGGLLVKLESIVMPPPFPYNYSSLFDHWLNHNW